MGKLLNTIAAILIIAWAIGVIGFQAMGLIHLLLLTAVITVLLRVNNERKAV